ncbi:hypothetical protein HELRODRAFT_177394 [Helobdella robusta]|uniref:Reverse transcriptase domain-containing protein n=1 Tax=Helobdella robusta TaxID=6412 RepID=T1FBM1_HELRO|nr:hypothetical protein HELRODRAFT_177394 [Helobdella robusta]ESN98151.1 hypothetical protein HELRODRAFT_177394 [Helobdella robusta]
MFDEHGDITTWNERATEFEKRSVQEYGGTCKPCEGHDLGGVMLYIKTNLNAKLKKNINDCFKKELVAGLSGLMETNCKSKLIHFIWEILIIILTGKDSRIIEHLSKNNIIGKSQHGFINKRSCLTNLLDSHY